MADCRHFIIESISTINEQAHITGVALIPRISRNDNLYTKDELKRFDGITVPLNWEHDGSLQIGTVTFYYNPTLETVYYEGDVTDEKYALLVKNKMLFTSIEAEPISIKTICNGMNDCFSMPFGLTPKALALTETPGVPETSVMVMESFIKENQDCIKQLTAKGYTNDQATKLCYGDLEGINDDMGDCIKHMKDTHPDMSHDQMIAACMNKTGESKENLDELKKELDDIKKILTTCPKCGGTKKPLNTSN